MKEETKRLIDEVQGIIDDAAAEKKDRNMEPDEIEIRQAAENFRDIMTRNGVDYFLSGKYQPKGDPKPKAFISLHGPSEGILRAMGGALYRIATDTKASPVSRLIFVASLREMLDDTSHALGDQIIELHRKGDTRHEN
ncbi:hypothetical protein [Megasphaera sp.]|uniref:hypothetical protein n=1 Tax=Megasphaera sp. TaxID=2023260 RepID=UPI00204D04F2|nr:MAG TPA: hypothetical protein [Caudoviricetes sp.]